MKGDFARVTFDPTLHYSQVFQQQGRVLLEADWNEQATIQLHLLRTMVRDLVGPCWAVAQGFSIAAQPHVTDWQLSPGHFYADGILCVNDAMCTLSTQPYAPTPDDTAYGGNLVDPPDSFALWLDVWERHLCAVEAPETPRRRPRASWAGPAEPGSWGSPSGSSPCSSSRAFSASTSRDPGFVRG